MRQRITISISQEAYLNLTKLMDEAHEFNTSRFIDTMLKDKAHELNISKFIDTLAITNKKKEEGDTNVKSNESERI